MSYKLWTKEEDELLRNSVNGELSYPEIAKTLFPDRTVFSIQLRASRDLGLDNTGYYGKGAIKHYHNKQFWSIPNPLNCYWAGFCAADACVRNPNNKKNYLFSLLLSSVDADHLEKFKTDINYTGQVVQYNSEGFDKSVVRLSCGEEWFSDLKNNFNIVPRKTKILQPPILTDYLAWCYLIGFIDGDGCLHVNKRDILSINITAASRDILEWVLKQTEGFKGKRDRKRKVRESGDYYQFSIAGEPCIKMFLFLREFPVPKLARKWQNPKIQELIDKNYSHLLK